MEFALNEEQQMMVEAAKKIGSQFGVDYWRELDARKAFPAEIWQAICNAGLCGAALPEKYGGSGLGMLDLALIVEALAEGGGGSTVGQLFMVNPIFGGVAISKFGSESQREAWLPKIISGQMHCCMALTEPNAGSNSLEITTFASRDGDGWRLNGQKIWITAVPSSHKILVVARTTRLDQVKRRTHGISMFIIDTDRAGVSSNEIDKLGTHTMPASAVFFDDVRVEPDELLGTLDHGWNELLDVLNTERIVTTAGLVGAGRLAITLAVNYAVDRKVFGGKPIGSYQGLQFPLAQAYAELLTPVEFNATTFPNDEQYDELVLVRDIPFQSLCAHHLLPFHGVAHVAYLPGERIIGISKLGRIVDYFARDLQVQERLTTQVADWLVERLQPRGIGVILRAEHLCMSLRGVQKPGAVTVTSALRGLVKTDPRTRQEFLSLAE